MAVILVGGSSEGAGKTQLICGLLSAFSELPWTAVKVTSHDDGQGAALWEETEAGEARDTARYLAAGAQSALLATVPEGDAAGQKEIFAELLDALSMRVDPECNILIESNRVAEYLKPSLCLMVHGGLDRDKRKASFAGAVRYADALVAQAANDRTLDESLMPAGAGPKPIFHLERLDVVSAEMADWVRGAAGL